MINMQINNNKLVNRGVSFIMDELKVSNEEALVLLNKYGLVKEALLQKHI